MTRTLLFDLDGTLVDTEAQHYDAFAVVFGRLGLPLDAEIYHHRLFGRPTVAIAAEFFPELPDAERLAIMAEKEAVYRSMLDGIAPIAGIEAFLDEADTLGLKRAVVTNAPIENAHQVLKGAGIAGRFDVVMSADEVAHAKPHPLPYLTGLARLGGAAERSIAFEDSKAGLTAAVAAGLTVVGIMSTLSEAEILDLGAQLAVRDYRDPRVRSLLA